jgi:hypothetical protein
VIDEPGFMDATADAASAHKVAFGRLRLAVFAHGAF